MYEVAAVCVLSGEKLCAVIVKEKKRQPAVCVCARQFICAQSEKEKGKGYRVYVRKERDIEEDSVV